MTHIPEGRVLFEFTPMNSRLLLWLGIVTALFGLVLGVAIGVGDTAGFLLGGIITAFGGVLAMSAWLIARRRRRWSVFQNGIALHARDRVEFSKFADFKDVSIVRLRSYGATMGYVLQMTPYRGACKTVNGAFYRGVSEQRVAAVYQLWVDAPR